jgi:hypothetical protein
MYNTDLLSEVKNEHMYSQIEQNLLQLVDTEEKGHPMSLSLKKSGKDGRGQKFLSNSTSEIPREA